MERFFAIIGRISSVLTLLFVLGLGSVITWVYWSNSQWQRRGAIEIPAEKSTSNHSVLLRFEPIENINGTNTQIIRLSAQEKSGKFYSGGYGRETRNILFLTGDEKKARWLFPKQTNLIIVTAQLREKSEDRKDSPVKAFYFEYVSEDSNDDGKLNAEDQSSVALSKPDGSGVIEILHSVNRVLSYGMLGSQQLSVVYQKDKSVRHAKIAIPAFTVETNQEITSIPDEL